MSHYVVTYLVRLAGGGASAILPCMSARCDAAEGCGTVGGGARQDTHFVGVTGGWRKKLEKISGSQK